MNISKPEQRVLHVLAKGGRILTYKDDNGKLAEIECYTREGILLSACDLALFKKLKSKRLIQARQSGLYLINGYGLKAVASQVDNR